MKHLAVKYWQMFLQKQKLLNTPLTGVYDEDTQKASIAFQATYGLKPDAIIGPKTLAVAQQKGFIDVFIKGFPTKPNFKPLGISERVAVFEKFDYVHKPQPDNKENIEILGDWEDRNIVLIDIPQLIPLKGNAKARFHKLVAPKAQKLFADWDKADLIDRIISWSGAFMPRFARNQVEKKILSNHAFGSAFDINVAENPLKKIPAPIGAKGCTRELVQIANENGFFWGGHFKYPLDGMHFELAVVGLKPKSSLYHEDEENAQDLPESD